MKRLEDRVLMASIELYGALLDAGRAVSIGGVIARIVEVFAVCGVAATPADRGRAERRLSAIISLRQNRDELDAAA